MLASAILALSLHASPRLRPRATIVASACDEFEYRALAGIWSTTLDLDDGLQEATCHLDARGSLTTTVPIEFNTELRWDARSSSSSEDVVRIQLSVGPFLLNGKGVREGGSLRCRVLKGSVLEGTHDPCCVGSFEMKLKLPAADADELEKLERSHRQRLDAKPAPAIRFGRSNFVGRWRLLIAFEESESPSVFSIELGDDHKFASIPQENDEASAAVLGGSWGLWDASLGTGREGNARRKRAARERGMHILGTHLYLRVERERCTETLKGLANLPVREAFSLWGEPDLKEGMLSELDARTEKGGKSDLVTGRCYFGTSADSEWVQDGRYSLLREEEADAVVDTVAVEGGADEEA